MTQHHDARAPLRELELKKAEDRRKRAERAVRLARRELDVIRSIVNRGPTVLFLWRAERGSWPVEFVSENAEQVLGYTSREFLSGAVSWPSVTHPEDVPRLEAEVTRFLETGVKEWSQEYRLITRTGEIRWVQDWNRALFDKAGRMTHVQALVVDITRRKQAEDELRKTRDKLRSLAVELTRTEDKERRRIADVLHEDLQQHLVGMQYMIGGIRKRKGLTDQSIQWLQKELAQVIQLSRDLTLSLRPPVLYDLGLRAALDWLAVDMQTRLGLTVRVTGIHHFRLENDELASFAFQAVRELLMNVVKHAGVKTASIRVRWKDKKKLAIEVTDQGRGFDPDQPPSETHFGLFSIRERIEVLGGSLTIASRPGKGVRAEIVLPARPPD